MSDTNIIMITGYRGSGKDTLNKQLSGTSHIPFNWIIYANPEVDKPFPHYLKARRVAFADILKDEVIASLGNILPEGFDRDRDKEMMLSTGKTFRQHCIDTAMSARAVNVDHWSTKAMSQVKPGESIVITDWRFQNEIKYCARFGSVTSIRVFRRSVPVPPADDRSEHDLDHEVTDFLLVTSEDDFNSACSLFPQYSSFVQVSN